MKPSLGQTIVAAGMTVVVVSIIAGVMLVGSPVEGRLQRLDSARIRDLRGIMVAIDSFWIRHERLPASLEDLMADPRVCSAPQGELNSPPNPPTHPPVPSEAARQPRCDRVKTHDPGSAERYGYAQLDERTYELCASFDRELPAHARRAPADFWSHGVGRKCFELNVDTSRSSG